MISVPSGCGIGGISLRGMIVLALRASLASSLPSCDFVWIVVCLRLSHLFLGSIPLLLSIEEIDLVPTLEEYAELL